MKHIFSKRENAKATLSLLRPMLDSEEALQFDMVDIEIVITGGEQDPLVPVSQTKEIEAVFSKAGSKVDLHLEETDYIFQCLKWLHSRI